MQPQGRRFSERLRRTNPHRACSVQLDNRLSLLFSEAELACRSQPLEICKPARLAALSQHSANQLWPQTRANSRKSWPRVALLRQLWDFSLRMRLMHRLHSSHPQNNKTHRKINFLHHRHPPILQLLQQTIH